MNLSFLSNTGAPALTKEDRQEQRQRCFYNMIFGDENTPAVAPTQESYEGALGYNLLRSH